MSHRATAWAWQQTGLTAPQKLALLALADHVNEKTGQCNPALDRLAERACCGRRTVVDAVDALERMGLVRAKRTGRSNQYELVMDEVREPHIRSAGPAHQDGDAKCGSRTSEVQQAPAEVQEPHIRSAGAALKPGKNRDRTKKGTKKTRARARRSLIPDDFAITDSMLAWAASTAPTVDVAGATAQFIDHHRAKGSTFKDHQAAWRSWMRKSIAWGPHRPAPYSAITANNINNLKEFVDGRG